ncbi:MAG: MFS transporter [Planctomycetia bacterium]|nr:MFS transporter [Planctomycetia bacterium]
MSESKIHFRCSRCTRSLSASKDQIGKKFYCPACYTQLTVPQQNVKAITDIAPQKLYEVDAVPIDVRDTPQRFEFYSLDCPLCYSKLAVQKNDIGKEIECPDCGRTVIVPADILEQTQVLKATPKEPRVQFVIPSFVKTKIDPTIDPNTFYGVQQEDAPPQMIDANGFPIDDNDNRPKFHPVVKNNRFAVYCPLCATMQYVSVDQIGQKVLCPECERVFPVFEPLELNPKPIQAGNISFEGGTVYGLANEEIVTLSPQSNVLISQTNKSQSQTEETSSFSQKTNSINSSNLSQSQNSVPQNRVVEKNSPKSYRNPDKDPNLVSVVCKLCGTLMYVPRNMLGKMKKCPDCYTETLVQDKTAEQKVIEQKILPKVTGGYQVKKMEPITVKPFLEESFLLRQVKTPLEKLMEKENKSSKPIRPPKQSTTPKKSLKTKESSKARNSNEDQFKEIRAEKELSSEQIPSKAASQRLPESVLASLCPPILSESAIFIPDAISSDSTAQTNASVQSSRKYKTKKRRKSSSSVQYSDTNGEDGIILRRKGDSVLLSVSRPPRFAMLNGIFRPLANQEVWFRLLISSSFIIIANFFFASVIIPMLMLKSKIDFSRLCILLFDISTIIQYIILPALFFIGLFFSQWLRLTGVLFMSIFVVISGGSRKIEEWIEEDYIGGLMEGGWLFLLIIFSALPGGLLDYFFLETQENVFFVLTFFCIQLFFPIFFLSSMQTGLFFFPITKDVFRSLFRCFGSWFLFYCWSFGLFGVPILLIWFLNSNEQFWIFITLIIIIMPPVYAVLIGRLAWVIEDSIRNIK